MVKSGCFFFWARFYKNQSLNYKIKERDYRVYLEIKKKYINKKKMLEFIR